jgi:RimJ/RimL family protein N-acetyltransferase
MDPDHTPVRLRPATDEDVDLVFAWANDPATRAASFRSGEIPYEEHVAWFEAQLARTDRNPRIAELGGAPVGFIRLDRSDAREGLCIISVNLAPTARGRGLGAQALAAATHEAARLGFDTIHALLRPENEASARAFQSAGYVELPGTHEAGRPARLFVRTT